MALPTPYGEIKPIGSYIPSQTVTTPGTTIPVIGGQSYTAPSTVSTTPGYVQWNQSSRTPVVQNAVAPQVAPKVTQPTVPQTTPTTPSTPSAVTAQTVNDLWLRQGETPEQYKVRTGITQPVGNPDNPVDNSVASLGELSQGQLDEIAAWDTLAKQGQADATGTFNTAGEQTKYTNIYQDRINSINALYNDMIAQSRANNAPIYAAREQQARLNASQSGLSSSPMGSAQIADVQNQNMADQQKLDAALALQQRQELQSVYNTIDTQVAKAQERFDQAKAEGGRTYADAIKNRNAVRRSILEEALGNVVGKNVSDADIKTLADKLGLSVEYVRNEFDKKNREYEASQATAQTQAKKDAADLEYKKAQTAKTTAETAQVGKMSPREAAQTEIEWYKATHPAKSASADKMNAVGTLANAFAPGSGVTIPDSDGVPFVDDRGYATPEGWKTALVASKEADMTRKEFIEEFGYLIKEGEESSYGLTAADIKIIRGALPTNE